MGLSNDAYCTSNHSDLTRTYFVPTLRAENVLTNHFIQLSFECKNAEAQLGNRRTYGGEE